MAETFLKTLLALSLGGTALAALLMLLRRLSGRRVPSGFWYAAWLIVLLRFVLPAPGLLALPRSGAATAPSRVEAEEAFGAPRPWSNEISPLPGVPSDAETLPEGVTAAAEEREERVQTRSGVPNLITDWTFWLCLWAAGGTGSALWYGIGYLRFRRALLPSLRPASEAEQTIRQTLYPRPWPMLCRSSIVRTPMLLGLLRPVIVLPDRDYTPEMLRGILRHELTHYRRGDLIFKWFAAAVCCVHWFNPVTLLLRREIDHTCELSCDEHLLRDMDREEKQRYGELLLMLAADRPLPRRVVAVSFATEKRNLKERLVQIMTFQKKSRAALALMLIAALLLAGCAAASGPGAAMAGAGAETPEETAAPLNELEEPEATPAPEEWTGETLDTYYVHTADEFLDALGSDRMLVLDAGEYNLTQAEHYGVNGAGYSWKDTMADGYELTLSNVENLTILGAGPGETSIVTEPRYANVLSFERCAGITAANLTVGHTVEPGYCVGGVLNFLDSDDVFIDNCDLYGCGTVGIIAANCRKIVADSTVIRECSYGAIQAESCYDVRFTGGEIHGCGRKADFNAFYLLDAGSTTGFVVYNTEIFDNDADILLRSNYSNGVELRGCEVRGNQFGVGMFSVQGVSPVVDGCALEDNALVRDWYFNYDGQTPGTVVNAAGKALSKPDFLTMTPARFDGDYEGPAVPEPEKPAGTVGADGRTEYRVTTTDEFLACIGSDTVIRIDMDTLDLSEATEYGGYGGTNYYWRHDIDGPTLVITGVENLTITGKGVYDTTVEAHPRYAMVLSFNDCASVTLRDLTAGHTPGQGACSGDVLQFRNCADCTVLTCGLFGCGVNGIDAYGCQNLTVQESVIYECSGYGAVVRDCYNTVFAGCTIRDCGYNQILNSDGDVTWDGKTPADRPELFA